MGIFKKDKTKKLRKEHQRLVNDAIHWQRNGKMLLYAEKTAEADKIYRQIQQIEAEQSS